MTEQNITVATPDANWLATVEYYIHRNVCYPVGAARSTSTSTQALASGLPAPASPVAVTLSADTFATTYAPDIDPARNPPLTYASTINTDGTWTLDDPLPAIVTAIPTDAHYAPGDGTTSLDYLSRFGLELMLVVPDGYPIGPTMTDTPPTPTSLAPYLGGDFTDIDSTIVAHGTRVHLAGSIQANVDGAGNITDGLLFNNLPDGLQPKHADGTLDTDNGGFMTVTDSAGRSYAVYISAASGGHGSAEIDTDQGYPIASEPTGFFPAGSASGGTVGRGDPAAGAPGNEFPEYSSGSSPGYLGLAEIQPQYRWNVASTAYLAGIPATSLGSYTLSIATLLSWFTIAPDWMQFFWNMSLSPSASPAPTIAANVASSIVNATGASVTYTPGGSSFGGYLKRSDLAGYSGDSRNAAARALLWAPADISSITFDPGYSALPGTTWSFLGMRIQFFWERARKNYLRAGDTISLDGLGWHSYFAPPTASTIAAGDATTGIIRLG